MEEEILCVWSCLAGQVPRCVCKVSAVQYVHRAATPQPQTPHHDCRTRLKPFHILLLTSDALKTFCQLCLCYGQL